MKIFFREPVVIGGRHVVYIDTEKVKFGGAWVNIEDICVPYSNIRYWREDDDQDRTPE